MFLGILWWIWDSKVSCFDVFRVNLLPLQFCSKVEATNNSFACCLAKVYEGTKISTIVQYEFLKTCEWSKNIFSYKQNFIHSFNSFVACGKTITDVLSVSWHCVKHGWTGGTAALGNLRCWCWKLTNIKNLNWPKTKKSKMKVSRKYKICL